MARIKYTDQQRQEMIERVDALRNRGLNLTDACKKAKVKLSYYNWGKAKLDGKSWVSRSGAPEEPKAQPQPQSTTGTHTQLSGAALQLPSSPRDRMIALIGHPEDVQRALETLVRP